VERACSSIFFERSTLMHTDRRHGDPVSALEREWRAQAAQRPPAWWKHDPALARFATPAALIRFLREPHAAALEDRVLLALVSHVDPAGLARRTALIAVLPALKNLVRRLAGGDGDRDELWEIVLAQAWEQIAAYPVARRPRRVAANLRMDTLKTSLRELRARRGDQSELTATGFVRAYAATRDGGEGVEELLARAVVARTIGAGDALLIAATRVDGVSLAAAAVAVGVSYNTAKVRRQRAERRLLEFLGYGRVPRGAQDRPLSGARVVGDGLSDLAGGNDQSHSLEGR
jgi:DNA-directed RNA polymerase specialized sigma24 family protein